MGQNWSTGGASRVGSSSRQLSAAAQQPFTHEDAKSLPLVPHDVYALMSLDVYKEPDRRPLPPGWSILMECKDVKLDREGFYAIAYVHDGLRHCVVAERGTTDALGIRAGIWMYFDEPTVQFSLADQFTKLVRLRLQMTRGLEPNDPNPYIISFTGHSLGGVLAACQACREHTYAITFENPGCRKFVDLTMHPFKADDVDIITYLRQPNPINTLRPHCGYLVQLPWHPKLPADHLRKGVAIQPADDAMPKPPAITSHGANTVVTVAATSAAAAASPTGSRGASGSPGAAAAATRTSASPATATGTAVAAAKPAAAPSAASNALQAARRAMITLTTPHEFLRSKILEASMPELQHYLSRVEPVIKELLDHTQQVHSIASIVDSMQLMSGSHYGQDVVLVWPSHLMQFLEYFNLTREMADVNNQDANLYAAYQNLLSRLYQTESRPKHKMPMKFLNKDSQRLLAGFLLAGRDPATTEATSRATASARGSVGSASVGRPDDTGSAAATPALGVATPQPTPTSRRDAASTAMHESTRTPTRNAFDPAIEVDTLVRSRVFQGSLASTGLTDLDIRFLRSLSIQGESLVSAVCTAFEAKQYLSMLVMRPRIRAALDRATLRVGDNSKL